MGVVVIVATVLYMSNCQQYKLTPRPVSMHISRNASTMSTPQRYNYIYKYKTPFILTKRIQKDHITVKYVYIQMENRTNRYEIYKGISGQVLKHFTDFY